MVKAGSVFSFWSIQYPAPDGSTISKPQLVIALTQRIPSDQGFGLAGSSTTTDPKRPQAALHTEKHTEKGSGVVF